MKSDWKWMLGVPGVLITVFGAAFAVDARYQHKLEADQQYAMLANDSEQARLETQLAIYRLELAQLRAKQSRTPDDELRIEYLESAIIKIQERLAGIVGD